MCLRKCQWKHDEAGSCAEIVHWIQALQFFSLLFFFLGYSLKMRTAVKHVGASRFQ